MTDYEKISHEIIKVAEKATPRPWAAESVGEKGDGSNMIGVMFHPDDVDALTPLEGFQEVIYDEETDEFKDYYVNETIAELEHRNRNSNYDALYILKACNNAEGLAKEYLKVLHEKWALERHISLNQLTGGSLPFDDWATIMKKSIGYKPLHMGHLTGLFTQLYVYVKKVVNDLNAEGGFEPLVNKGNKLLKQIEKASAD